MPDNMFKGSYEGASSTGSEQQIHKKAVFFDADGTICDIEKGTPASAVEAITKLVKNGHQAWLCTGRSRAFVPDYLEQIPFQYHRSYHQHQKTLLFCESAVHFL